MMRKAWVIVILLAAAPRGAVAEVAALDATQRHGRALFLQDCGVCHTKPNAGVYAPALGKDSLNGQADMMRDVISDGTPRMPGFKHELNRGEIDAIVAYMKTVPMPPAAAPAPAPAAAAPRMPNEAEGDR
jgi:mono/diheme cytochrome c family protein